MILKLLREEFYGRRKAIALVSMVLLPGLTFSIAAGADGYRFAVPLTVALMLVAYNQRIAYEEEKAGMLYFLRSLPISPVEIICVRALTNVVVAVIYTVLALIATALCVRFIPGHGSPNWWSSTITAVGGGLFAATLVNAVYFRLGAKAVGTFFTVVIFVAAIPGLASNPIVKGTPAARFIFRAISDAATWRTEILGLVALLAMVAGWVYAARALGRKELL